MRNPIKKLVNLLRKNRGARPETVYDLDSEYHGLFDRACAEVGIKESSKRRLRQFFHAGVCFPWRSSPHTWTPLKSEWLRLWITVEEPTE